VTSSSKFPRPFIRSSASSSGARAVVEHEVDDDVEAEEVDVVVEVEDEVEPPRRERPAGRCVDEVVGAGRRRRGSAAGTRGGDAGVVFSQTALARERPCNGTPSCQPPYASLGTHRQDAQVNFWTVVAEETRVLKGLEVRHGHGLLPGDSSVQSMLSSSLFE
jgi:hypothetical protein